MHFGRTNEPAPLTYGGYLRVPELLALQELKSSPPRHDETLFIIIHQVYELWFKQLLHELDTIIGHLHGDEVLAAHRLVRRCIEIQRVLVSQIAVLETMTPMHFLAFRDHLMPASGFQSAQFRELEFLCGLKEPRYLNFFDPSSPEYAKLQRRMADGTLGEAFDDLLTRRGFPMPRKLDDAAHAVRMDSLTRLYHEADQHYDLFLLTESLIEFDEQFVLWRLRHVKMVERMIGTKTGTGGTTGAAYLRTTTDKFFFPDLWEVRGRLGTGAAW
jgi:tryptophan 2,3-dioxygenase